MKFGNIKLVFDQDSIKYSVSKTSEGKQMVVCTMRYHVKNSGELIPMLLYMNNDNQWCHNVLYNENNVAVGKAVLSEDDEFDITLGQKVARTKAESNAYRIANKALYRMYKELIKGVEETTFKFVDKACDVISHNEMYLNRLVSAGDIDGSEEDE